MLRMDSIRRSGILPVGIGNAQTSQSLGEAQVAVHCQRIKSYYCDAFRLGEIIGVTGARLRREEASCKRSAEGES
jgi:hypothetical protein